MNKMLLNYSQLEWMDIIWFYLLYHGKYLLSVFPAFILEGYKIWHVHHQSICGTFISTAALYSTCLFSSVFPLFRNNIVPMFQIIKPHSHKHIQKFSFCLCCLWYPVMVSPYNKLDIVFLKLSATILKQHMDISILHRLQERERQREREKQ